MRLIKDDFSLRKVFFTCMTLLSVFSVFLSAKTKPVSNSIGALEMIGYDRFIPKPIIIGMFILILILTVSLLLQKEDKLYYIGLSGLNALSAALLMLTEKRFNLKSVFIIYLIYIVLYLFIRLYLKYVTKIITNKIILVIIEMLFIISAICVWTYMFESITEYLLATGIIFSAIMFVYSIILTVTYVISTKND